MIKAEQFPLLDHISSGILGIDSDANIVLWNERMEFWTGKSRDELIGQNLFQAFPETAANAFKIRIEQVLGGGAPVIFSAQLHHHLIACPLPDGSFRTQLVTVTWLEQQQVALFSIQDLTEQAKLVEQYKTTAHELQSELDQRRIVEKEKLQLATAIDQAGEAVV
ncbi:MAG: PAS domain-containing protein, partial [Mariprofundus sp.]